MKRLRPRWALLAVFALVLVGLGSACSVVDPPALTVDGRELSRSELFEQVPDFASQQQTAPSGSEELDPAQVAEFLTERVYIFLIENEVEARGLDVDAAASSSTSAPQNDYEAAIQEALAGREALLVALGEEAGLDDAAVEELAEELYEQNKSTLGTPGSTCLSAIFVAAAEVDPATGQVLAEATDEDFEQALADAEAAKARVDAGEEFGAVAETDSDIPPEQAPNGEVGCLSDEEVASIESPSLAEAIPALEVDEVSEPIKVDIGYYVLTVTSRSDAEVPAFDDVADQFREEARRQLSGDAYDAWLARELEAADISVDSRFGTWNAETFVVDPPTGATPAGPTTTSPLLGGEVSPVPDEAVSEEVG